LQVHVAGLLDHVGHGHKGVGFFPRIVHLGAQGSDLFFDQSMIFLGWTIALGWSDQAFGKQRQNGVEDLLATRLRPQDSARLFHLAAFLPTAMPTAMRQVFFHLLPGRASSLCGKEIKMRPEVGDDLIDGDDACIQQPQRLSLHGIGQANGKGERLGLGHLTPPVLQAPALRRLRALVVCVSARHTSDRQRKR